MLKIKDSVDLKELEKFCSVRKTYDSNTGKIEELYCRNRINSKIRFLSRKKLLFKKHYNGDFLVVDNFAPNYDNGDYFNFNKRIDFDLLYDLIKADMVEKVEENK